VAIPSPAPLWRFARAIEQVFELDRDLKEALARIDGRFEAVEARVIELGIEQRTTLVEVRAAAIAAGSSAAAMHTAELARQIGVLQEQVRTLQSTTGIQPGLATT